MQPGSLAVAALLAVTACSNTSSRTSLPVVPTPTVAPSPSSAATPPSPTPSPSPSPSPASSPSVTVATPKRCTSAHLRLSVQEGDGGAGQFHQPLVLTNRGPRCTLHGYPGVSFVDSAGRTLGSPADQTPGTVRRVLVEPGRSAVAVLEYSNALVYPDSSCRPQRADRVRVYPPGERTPLLVADPILVCSAKGAGQLHIEPVTRG